MPDVRRGEPFGPEVAPSFVQSPLQLPLFLDQQKKAGLLFFPLLLLLPLGFYIVEGHTRDRIFYFLVVGLD